ncbi:glycoside hydrolase family 16 protein, partial [Dendrothele bispora CBS 962.96]
MAFGLSTRFFLVVLSLARAVTVWGAWYGCSDSFSGYQFLEGFTLEAIADPTRGRVNYVDADTAARLNLTYATEDRFIARADSTTVLDSDGPGRNSVRMQSKKQYGNGVMVFNINHIPEGCGTWPAVWSYSEPWPTKGEIDVVEGVNNQAYSQGTLHTLPICNMSEIRWQKGSTINTNCDYSVNFNAGCGVAYSSQRSFGPEFNANGGGWFAVERTDDFIKIWFWARDDILVPPEVRFGLDFVVTDTWGKPEAFFPNTMCDIEKLFGDHNIIINLTFCGDWAGNAYLGSGCPARLTNSTPIATCEDYVNNNPAAFKDAYFDFSWIKVYA